MTKTIPFTSTPKVSKNVKTSKQSVEALKKARSKNVSESKQSHVEKPDINNIKAGKSTLNKPIINYIKRTYQVNAVLKRHFLDELLKIDNAKLLQDSSMSNRDVATLSSLRETSMSPSSPEMYRMPNVLKEELKKKKKKKKKTENIFNKFFFLSTIKK